VKDVDGNNLLDPEFEGNILGNRIEVTHNQGKYPLILSEYAYGEYGLHTGGIGDDETPGILFWFFYIGKDSGGDEFTIDWGDGTSGFVKFDYYYTLDFFCNITNHENIYYNGEAKSNNSLIISLVK
jgi:hypothetical protein